MRQAQVHGGSLVESVSSLEPSGPEAEILPLGHCGLWISIEMNLCGQVCPPKLCESRFGRSEVCRSFRLRCRPHHLTTVLNHSVCPKIEFVLLQKGRK
ncbi:hypothetical protein AVEN_181266-1 [Araneus ventricosus]|uniref:Uncharacterized protein n=1 Tax=Araneus ventricosus TaxID=182803 RepID=A0A4Y2QMY5_ARAVE|nr:hypothetical protein AVEN_126757-1 [Araneus ventricosus]GBN64696.1 hypothetical protein AVEN_181266-1 [Araneus ventricosus]